MANLSRTTLTLKRSPPTSSAKPAQITPPRPITEPLLGRFWFVWSPQAVRPKKRHATAEAAQTEAARLRGIAPERQFLVYEARRIDFNGGAP